MTLSDGTVGKSSIDFRTAMAYAFQPVLRRLVLVAALGAVLVPMGLTGFLDPTAVGRVGAEPGRFLWLGLALFGSVVAFGGLLGALFTLVADANYLADNR